MLTIVNNTQNCKFSGVDAHTSLNATMLKNLLTPKAKLTIVRKQRTYHDAPTTDREIESPIPRDAHMNGEVWSKNLTRRGQFFL